MWKWYCHHSKSKSQMSSLTKITKVLPPFLFLSLVYFLPIASSQKNSAFFNSTSLISIPYLEWDLTRTKEVTFRTCSDSGYLLKMNGLLVSSSLASQSSSSSGFQSLSLLLLNKSVVFEWSVNGQSGSVKVGSNINNNTWYTATLRNILGSLKLSLAIESNNLGSEVTIANSSLNSGLLNVRLNGTLKIGEGFIGCMYQGPGVNFSSDGGSIQNITWDNCPLLGRSGCNSDQDIDDCWSNPCQNSGTCIDGFKNFSCHCPTNYNGSMCENDLAKLYGCQVSPCLNGGTCHTLQNHPAFNCSCLPGYNGLTCKNEIDLCRLSPCVNGVCLSGINNYTCNCSQTGYTGVNCSVNIDECAVNSSICGTNGQCYDTPGTYTCDCILGFTGKPCQNINECLSQPCKNGGTCTDHINSFKCTCPANYTGTSCEYDINDDCASNPCTWPNSKCKDQDGGYQCICLEGYTGNYTNCTDINECNLQYCQHASNCSNTPGNYICSCQPGYSEKNCSIDINECSSNPCRNGSNCTDLVNGYSCSCLPGLTGQNCDTELHCLPGKCHNNATCHEQVNGFTCLCNSGYTGIDCATEINECNVSTNPCLNGAQCIDLLNDYICNCTAGYEGKNCTNEINKCRLYSNPCQHNGTCMYTINDYYCNCTSDWMGKNCTDPYNACASQPCQNKGICSSQSLSHTYSCSCAAGFTGQDCSININDCVNVTCGKNRTCYDRINNYTCDCPIGYTGQNCETEIDQCQTQPCQNGGKCTSMRGNYTCTCPNSFINITLSNGVKKSFETGYSGVNCQDDINECLYMEPSVCQNGALCQNIPQGSFTCYCKTNVTGGEMYVGALCEQLRSYCDIRLANQTCQNGGTCLNLPTSSVCKCALGYSGQLCEININDCESNPCQYNGTCTDLVNNYTCSCIDGVIGRNCETNIDDCAPNPCLNNGICHDRINNYTCDCNNTGFTGPRCEQNIDDCASSLCQNGGNCTDGLNNYTCQCYKGYTGANCQTDIPECSPNPCQYNSTCLEYSNKTLYDKNDTHFVNFTYEKAAGYLCVCVAGVKGENCSEDIDDCDPNPCLHNSTCKDKFNNFSCVCSPGYQGTNCSIEINECDVYKPCQYGGVCTDKIADYLCTCQPPVPATASYGGKNCSTLLSGCTGNNCKNGQCIPKLDYSVTPENHSYDCICSSGYTGRYCDILTSVSFVSTGNHFKINMNMSVLEFSVNFRTTLPSVILMVLKLMGGDAFMSVYLEAGRVKLKYKDSAPQMLELKTLLLMNDSNYHSLHLSFSGSGVILSLPADKCAPDIGAVSTAPQACSKSLGLELQRNITFLYVGSAALLSISNEIFPNDFVGCMQDLKINQQLYYHSLYTGNFVNVTPGCSRSVQCITESCGRHGTCEDLWDKYQCHCYRPYNGTDCQQEYPAATFGVVTGSYVDFVFGSYPNDNYSISFFIVTRQQDGFIMLTSNGFSTYPSLLTIMALYIKNFQLSGDFYRCNYSQSISTNASISDGQRHFISIIVKGSNLAIYLDSGKIFEKLNMPQLCKEGFGFSVAKLSFGAYRGIEIRIKRSALISSNLTYQNEISLLRKRRQATSILNNLSSLPSMEGVIQDFQMNGKIYSFEDAVGSNYTPGAVSTHDVCPETPCQNGGTCNNKFYNDYDCICVRGYTGKNCTELDFCSYGSCPSESKCINIPLGYECVSEASFLNDDSSITYVMNGSIPEPIVTFSFRTRGLYGLIFLLRLGDYFFKLRVANGSLEINSKLSSAFSETATTYVQTKVNDGKWYSAKFEIINETYVSLDVFHEGKTVDYTKNRIINGSSVNINDMLKYGEIVLGNTLRQKYSRNWEANFRGCLREVRMGGVLMPFYYDETFENNTVPVKFMAKKISGIIHHCTGDDVCSKNVCLNGGQCVDNWNSFTCSCPKGFYGEYCQDNTDNCAGRYCQNGGLCVDGLDSSSCVCPVGFTNQYCEDAVNLCAGNQCMNNSTCMNSTYDYTCSCVGTLYTGWYCNVSIYQNCSSSPCQNNGKCQEITVNINNTNYSSFNCTCQTGFEGPLCEKAVNYCNKDGIKCANNGTCENHPEYHNYTCSCASGYEGPNCTNRKDNCLLAECQHGGTCIDGGLNYTCKCSSGFHGAKCENYYDPCSNSSFCQNGHCLNGVCNCSGSGWKGDHCEQQVNECTDNLNTCLHESNCTDLEGDYDCNCTLGYSGKNCENANCSDIHCENNGTCEIHNSSWSCKCAQFTEGQFCERKGQCFDHPCQYAKACNQSIENNTYMCDCLEGWKGVNCSDDIDECNETKNEWRHKCQNGSCLNTRGNYTCICFPGYTDRFCEVDINECQSNPCQHQGICTDLVNNYTCNCNGTGYDGQNCSHNINECNLNVTLCNKGDCKDEDPFYSCICGEYFGDHCQFDNPCINFTCLNGGKCKVKNETDSSLSSYCSCSQNYEGVSCEKSPSTKDTDLGIIIGPIVGGIVLIIIVIVVIAFIMTARSKRATRGTYSPSQQETSGSRVELGNVLKKPPEERLI